MNVKKIIFTALIATLVTSTGFARAYIKGKIPYHWFERINVQTSGGTALTHSFEDAFFGATDMDTTTDNPGSQSPCPNYYTQYVGGWLASDFRTSGASGHTYACKPDNFIIYLGLGTGGTISLTDNPEYTNTADGSYRRTYTVETDTFTLPQPTKSGFVFKGYCENASTCTSPEENVTIVKGSHYAATYNAVWEAENYTITYNTDSGYCTGGDASNHNCTPISYNIQSATITLPTPKKTGWKFGGWCDDSTLTTNCSTSKTIPNGSTGNKEYWAKWVTPDTHTIYYACRPGTYHSPYNTLVDDDPTNDPLIPYTNQPVLVQTQTIQTGQTFTKLHPNCEYPGYKFYNDVNDYTCMHYRLDQQTTYGDSVIIAGISDGSTYSSYTYVDDNDGETKDSVVVCAASLTRATYNINYYDDALNVVSADDARWGSGNHPTAYQYQSNISINAPLNKTEYTFDGWCVYQTAKTDTDFSGCTPVKTLSWYSYDGSRYGDYYLYAQWTANEYQINYEQNGGTCSGADAPDCGQATYTIEDNVVLEDPVKTGHDFGGWCKYTSAPASGTTCDAPTIDPQASATTTIAAIVAGTETGARWFYANWGPHPYDVIYNCGTGAAGTPPTHGTDGKQVFGATFTWTNNTGASCQKAGYHFNGWLCTYDDTNNTPLTNNTTYNQPYSATCVAQWAANDIHLQWDNNGGTSTGGDTTCTYGIDDDITLPTMNLNSRPGYTFKGWNIVTP